MGNSIIVRTYVSAPNFYVSQFFAAFDAAAAALVLFVSLYLPIDSACCWCRCVFDSKYEFIFALPIKWLKGYT